MNNDVLLPTGGIQAVGKHIERVSVGRTSDGEQPRKGPNSFYKGRSKKVLIKLFMEKGHSKERSRQLAKVWLGLKDSEREEIMASQTSAVLRS